MRNSTEITEEHPAEINEIVLLDGVIEDLKDVPTSTMPYYLIGQNGAYLHKKSLLGTSLIPTTKFPKALGEIKADKGIFWFTAERIPATLCAQIVSFFRRIWETHKAEAEVLLTFNPDTKEWRAFIPTQKVSTTSVEMAYEPAHIKQGFYVVGTMHSHCNFSAFHSGTDINDAQNSGEGIHLTIGFVDRKVPQVVAMVMVGGIQFNFSKIEVVADFDFSLDIEAPLWWDQYVTPTSSYNTKKPVGSEAFTKYSKPKVYTPPQSSYHTPGPYGSYYKQPQNVTTQQTMGDYLSQKSKESPNRLFDDDLELERVFLKDYYDKDVPLTPGQRKILNMYFAPSFPHATAFEILESNLLTDDDWDAAFKQGKNADLSFYRLLLLQKFQSIMEILETLGLDVDLITETSTNNIKELPATTSTKTQRSSRRNARREQRRMNNIRSN